jgi:hypothetical protein
VDVNILISFEHVLGSISWKKVQKRNIELFVHISNFFMSTAFKQLLSTFFRLVSKVEVELLLVDDRLSHVFYTSVELNRLIEYLLIVVVKIVELER